MRRSNNGRDVRSQERTPITYDIPLIDCSRIDSFSPTASVPWLEFRPTDEVDGAGTSTRRCSYLDIREISLDSSWQEGSAHVSWYSLRRKEIC